MDIYIIELLTLIKSRTEEDLEEKNLVRFIRYPGGKQRLLRFLMSYLPSSKEIKGTFIEPFVGGGAVFFAINPRIAILADINPVLIDLYHGLKNNPAKIWDLFSKFPRTKKAYYGIRDSDDPKNLPDRAAKTLYLNRTCFKGMWRENASGKFNVGYGGEGRRWVVDRKSLMGISKILKKAVLKVSDFEGIIDNSSNGDFIFLDPPYRPGHRDLIHNHYVYSKFTFADHKRLARTLRIATKRNVRWAVTTSSHPEILSLFRGNRIIPIFKGTGQLPGIMSSQSGEALICNYDGGIKCKNS